jgi:FkbH-like protein
VCATSFVPPGNPAWAPLAALAPLAFGDYGDWPAALLSSERQALLWFLFLEDVVAPDTLEEEHDFDRLLAPALDPLIHRLGDSPAPVVVAWSGWRAESLVRQARAPTSWRALIRRLEQALYDIAARHPALHLLSLDEAFAGVGLEAAFDSRNFYAAHCRLSHKGLRRAAESATAIFGRMGEAARKVLVLDCDNTLWGGVVGEVGIEGLTLGGDGSGKAFTDFQHSVRRLARQGVLLALASKNNEDEVWRVFDTHPGMALGRGDIVAWRIDWCEKSDNLVALAADLDLGLDSFAFWDDNPLEREKMRLARPEVATIEMPDDVTAWPALLDRLDLFARFSVTSEDRRKSEQYKSRAVFIGEIRAVVDEASFLRSIAMQPVLLPVASPTLARAEQLCAKTNQWNLRTARHDAAALAALSQQCGDACFLMGLSDRFGDHGIVGLAIARPGNEGVAFLDTMLMSCRVLGRHVEAFMLGALVERLRRAGARHLLAEFRPSGRNAVAEGFLAAHGFAPLAAGDLTAGTAGRVAAAAGCTGTLFIADLDRIVIPHLELFDHDTAEPRRAAAAAVS